MAKMEPLGELEVCVYKADGLASADMNGKSDPFVRMNLVNQKHRSSTQYKTLNPVWNEMFAFKIYDINNQLDLLVYDEDRHGEDFLGRLMIPLLSIKHKKPIWYQLKDKKLQNPAKGKILLQFKVKWSLVKACIRTFNPLEKLKDPPAAALKRSLVVSNFMRAKTQLVILVEVLKYIRSCFYWEHKLRSLNAFILFIVITYYFELWMVPLLLLTILNLNYCIISYPRFRDILGLDEATFSSLTDVRAIMPLDEPLEESSLFRCHGNWKDNLAAFASTVGVDSAGGGNNKHGFGSFSDWDGNNNSSATSKTASTTTDNASDDGKTMLERLQAGRDVVIQIQNIVGDVASYLERITNTFLFKVPFLSHLMMFCLAIATVLLYLVPLRYIVMAWGINKFTKRLRSPNAIDNNELLDFLSRVPDNIQCIRAKNTIIF